MDYHDVIAVVNKYKECLSPENDVKKIFHALQKLNKVDMTIDILHKTGIGKSVNKLKKVAGVGDFSKQLVFKWKALLAAQQPSEDSQCETKSVASDEERYDPTGNWEMNKQDDGIEEEEEYDPTQNWKMQKKNPKDKAFHNKHSSSQLKYDNNTLITSTTSEESGRHFNKNRKKPSKSSVARPYHESCSDDDYPSSDSNTENSHQSETPDSEDECQSPDSTTYIPSVQSKTVYSTSYDNTASGRVGDNAMPGKSKHLNTRNSDHRKPECINAKNVYKPSSKSVKNDSTKISHIKEGKKTVPRTDDRRMDATTSTGKRKLESTEYSSQKKINQVKKVDGLYPTKKNSKEKVKPSKDVKVNSSKSSFKVTQTNGEINPKKRKSTSTKKVVSKKASGDFSFEDFMMMDTTKVTKKKKILKDPVISSADKPTSKAATTVKPKVELHLPKIQQTYRPLPNSSMQSSSLPSKPSKMTDAMAAELHTQRSSNKMVVYSGHKKSTLTEVLSLYDQCMAVLKNNIDRLDFIGVPYDIIKPVLERCTVEQLYRLEDCNNYLLEDTDELWMKHAMVDFRSLRPDDMESWREMYLRLHDEREQKLTRLTHLIQAKVNKAKPLEKRTKLAYVGAGEAKAPRNVLRAQLKYGTAGKKTIPYQKSSSSSSSSQGSSSDSMRQKLADVRMAVPVGSITAASVDNALPSRSMRRQPPRVAPMMAKTLKSFKLRYKR